MNSILRGAAVVGQSGGPTAAINASLAGVIETCILHSDVIPKVYGMRNGIEGFLEERLVELNPLFTKKDGFPDTDGLLKRLVHTPASALGSCRKKLPKPADDPGFYENLVALFKKYDIRYFFYIGGNDSMDTVAKLTEYLRTSDYEMRVMGVPKTIDNDLMGTDHTPGFGSAAKYIAAEMQEIVRDCAVYTVKAVTIVEIMGRDAGWLTASAALPNLVSGAGPDYVYLPEVPFDMEAFFGDIARAFERHPNVVVAISEGARFADGRYVGEGTQSGAVDVFGHKYLEGTAKTLELAVKERFGCKVRSIELNLPQRCASHLASATDLSESHLCGENAVSAAIDGLSGKMIAMERAEDSAYRIRYVTKDVTQIANAVRTVPREWIVPENNNVTDECLGWILPLIRGEAEGEWKDGLPVHFVLE
ncbi:MAG: 6-phosphofructokinase [Clostridia bacterium]|nr:6-phosphofructokinase [Clostridia bacterium]